MRDFIRTLKGYSGYIFGGIAFDGYRRTLNTSDLNRVIEESTSRLEKKISYMDKLRAQIEIDKDKITGYENKQVSIKGRIIEYMEQLKVNKAKLVEYSQKPETNDVLIQEVHRQSVDIMEKVTEELKDLEVTTNLEQATLEATIQKISDSSSSTNEFVSGHLESINTIFSELSTAQLGAIGHILIGIGIYYSVANIASAYYGDKLITYFKLEIKYPRLAK
jgi:hypothetical protein